MKPQISIAELRQLMALDPSTGVLTWIVAPNLRVKPGDPAGCLNPQGYLVVQIKSRRYNAHRVVWALHHGSWPVGQIDHINGLRADNRVSNLRDVTVAENAQNRTPKGFSWHKLSKKWESRICVNGRVLYLGRFDDMALAREAYLSAKAQLHPASVRVLRSRT